MRLAQKKQKRKVLHRLYRNPNKELQLKDGNRLTRDEQLKLIQWLVELKTYQQISDLIKEEFKKDITRQAVYFYAQSKKWKPIIVRLRNRFEKNVAAIPIANKTHRLRILQKVIDEGLTWSLKGFSKDGDEIYELKLGAVTEAIKAAKEELEPSHYGKGVNVSTVIINIRNQSGLLTPSQAELISHQRSEV